jgi:hypothetical protein
VGGHDFARQEQELNRFRHVMPWLVQAAGETFEGTRVLNFWDVSPEVLGVYGAGRRAARLIDADPPVYTS